MDGIQLKRSTLHGGIELLESTLTSISGNLVQNCGRIAISLSGQSNVIVKDNTFVDCEWGLTSRDGTFLVVRYAYILQACYITESF